jgi:proline-specific peptidase
MGNANTPEQKARNYEKKLLEYSGLIPDENLSIQDIPIDYNGHNYIHTIFCGQENKNVLVLIHGYGGSNIFYFKMLKNLSEHFRVISFDLLGMGLSSRPYFNCDSTEETIEFFIESIENWRQNLNLDNIILCGHSFGGYIACHYTLKYSKSIRGLCLISPMGFTKDNTGALDENFYKKFSYFTKERYMYSMRLDFFKKKKTISEMAAKYSWLAKLFIKKRFLKYLKVPENVGEIMWEYLMEIFSLPASSEKALHYLVNNRVKAFIPLEDIVPKIYVPISVYYGDSDWMCSKGAENIYESQRENFRLIIIEQSGHQIMMQNPDQLIKEFIEKLIILEKDEKNKKTI